MIVFILLGLAVSTYMVYHLGYNAGATFYMNMRNKEHEEERRDINDR